MHDWTYTAIHQDHVQIDVEGCELEVLQGIQPHHWSQISQVSNQEFAMLSTILLRAYIE